MDLNKLFALEYSPGQNAFHVQTLYGALRDNAKAVCHALTTGELRGDPYFLIGVYSTEEQAHSESERCRPLFERLRQQQNSQLSNITIGELLKQIGK